MEEKALAPDFRQSSFTVRIKVRISEKHVPGFRAISFGRNVYSKLDFRDDFMLEDSINCNGQSITAIKGYTAVFLLSNPI